MSVFCIGIYGVFRNFGKLLGTNIPQDCLRKPGVLYKEGPHAVGVDEILPPKGSYSEVPLGLVQIPTELIVGTKTEGRKSAFAANFMPILKENTEFASKWMSLSVSHVEEGIREPIKAYEYMNKFYVEEGNKRVSVMKYFDVVSIPGNVIRIIPQRTEDKENKIYYEFNKYLNREYRFNEVLISNREEMENEVMLGLRKLGGISISLFKKKFNKDIFEEFNIKYALDQGMIEISDDFIYIPEDKIYVMNEIINTII